MDTGQSARERTVVEVLGQVCGRPPEGLRPEMDLAADLSVDSPKALMLLASLEERLGIEILDEDAARMRTVGDVLAFVRARGAPGG